MKKIKKGDIVVRKSYGKDIIFYVKRILNGPKIAILSGVLERIEADSDFDDLEIIDKKVAQKLINEKLKSIEIKIEQSKKNINRIRQKLITGKILHLDGDKKYSQKSVIYYKKMGLKAIVKYVPEYEQPKLVRTFLKLYKPDILVITGHDAIIKKGTNYNDIYNYRNSKYFINTVREARKYERTSGKDLAIFAGACQSYYEAIISAGANFASSPARILIDFLDPLIVAEQIAITERNNYITIDNIEKYLRDGKMGIGGIGSRGKMHIID